MPAGRVLIDGTRTGRNRRRGAARPAAPGGRRPGRGGRGHQRPDRARSSSRRRSSRAAWRSTRGTTRCCARRRTLLARAIEERAARGTHGPGPAEGTDSAGDAADVSQARRTPAARPAGRDGSVRSVTLAESALSRRVSEFAGVALFAAGADLADCARAATRRTIPSGSSTTSRRRDAANFAGPRRRVRRRGRRSSCSATRRSCCPVVLGFVGWHYFWCHEDRSGATRSSSAPAAGRRVRRRPARRSPFGAFDTSRGRSAPAACSASGVAAVLSRVPESHRRGDPAAHAARALGHPRRRSSRSAARSARSASASRAPGAACSTAGASGATSGAARRSASRSSTST